MAESNHIDFFLYPRVQGQSREVFESETDPDPFLASKLEIAGLLAVP